MTCEWCHEFCPPNRKDGFCSDICKEWNEQASLPPLCVAKAYGGNWCIGQCVCPKDCSARPLETSAEARRADELPVPGKRKA
jgi:hypothetical protein